MQPFWDWLHAYATRWHDTWEIGGAVATAGALVAAVVGINIERRARHRAEKAAHDASHRSQADRVVGVPGRVVNAYPNPRWAVMVYNLSDGPVFDLTAVATLRGAQHTAVLEVAVPQTHMLYLEPEISGVDDNLTEADFHVVMEFRDMAGVTWRRDGDGRLADVSPPSPLAT